MRVYIAGPMAGIPDYNHTAFEQRAKDLEALDHIPANPSGIKPPAHDGPCLGDPVEGRDHHYGCQLRAGLEMLMYCDAISLLPGWQESRGASTEEHVARSLGLFVMHDGTPIRCGFCDGTDFYGPIVVKHKIFVHRDSCPIDVDQSL